MSLNNEDLLAIVQSHNNYYEYHKLELSELTKCYKQELYKRDKASAIYSGTIIVEPPAGFSFVEGYMASLFPKAPSVEVGPDAKQKGNPVVVQAVCNRFLYDQAELIERAMRYALIYPFSFLKLGFIEADDVIDRLEMKPVYPWDVLIDFDAETFDKSRYVGHRYWLPISEAKEKFGNKKFITTFKKNFVDDNVNFDNSQLRVSGLLSYVEIYEIYDFMNDELIMYTPNLEREDKILSRDPIPFRKYNGRPLAPLVPLYFGYAPDVPLQGASSLQRVYDSIIELINLRTTWANGIRRDARIYVARKGVLDEESKAVLAENRDGSIVELDLPADVLVSTAITPLLQNNFSPDFSIYKSEVNQDLNSGSVLAPFTRGIATNATATEIAALTQYSASEIGKLARIRDRSIEYLAEVYTALIAFLLYTDENEKEVVTIAGDTHVLVAKDFIGKFKFAAAEQSSTPISSAIKKQQLAQLIPMLTQLGVQPDKLLEEIVRAYELPQSFVEKVAAGLAPDQLEQAANPSAVPVGGGDIASLLRNAMK